MIISINWLKKFTDIDGSISDLVSLIGSRLVEIEEVIDLGAMYKGIVVVKVVECKPLEGSDHLNVTKVDDGGVVKNVERDENGLAQVVCGAPNVHTGMLAAWLPPETTVPSTFGDKEPFVLGVRPLRGVTSNGMLGSSKELSISDDHEGILEIHHDVKPGTMFAEVYELDDYLLNIENKSLTHRPDTFGIIGFAREVAGIQGKVFATPTSLATIEPSWIPRSGDIETPQVTIDDPALSGRYQAVVLTDVNGKVQSPIETQTYLGRINVRSISAVVDVTNYLMMLTGQPLHAFDYDKLLAVGDGKIDIHVRGGRPSEKLTLLDGREIELHKDDIVIANGNTAVALAGAMGGASTEIDENTTRIMLESATFNLYNLRTTQMRHGIFSEAITRFTKGQPAALTAPVLAEAIKLLSLSAGARRASEIVDAYPGATDPIEVVVAVQVLNETLGSNFTIDDIATTLEHVEFKVEKLDGAVKATAPYWRADIHIPEDIIEEVGRLNGFDTITPTLPLRDFTAISPVVFDELRAKIRQILARAGANEVLTYSFVHGDLLAKAGQKPEESYRLTNSLSPDLQYYRQTLTPSLLGLVHANSKAGFDEFALFELNKGHWKPLGLDEESVPKESDYLALTVAAKKSTGAAYYQAKRLLDYLARQLGFSLVYTPIDKDPGYPESAPFEYRRSAMVSDAKSGTYLGIVGEYKASVKKAFKLPSFAAGFELSSRAIASAAQQSDPSYAPLSKYPSTERDVCFRIENTVRYQQLIDAAQSALSGKGLAVTITPVDIYQLADGTAKHITIRIVLTSYEKTLSGEEIAAVVDTTAAAVTSATGGAVI